MCSASDQCHDAGTCNPGTGQCSNPNKANGSSCNDGDKCTQADTCQAGACTGANPVVCGALDDCHVAGTCDTQTGACSNPTKTEGVACAGGVCNDAGTCTTTNLVVMRVGTGAAALTSASTAAFLERLTSDGAAVATITLPTVASGQNLPLTVSGTATSEGNISRAANGAYVVVPGYAAVPGVASITGTTSAATNRLIGRVNGAGVVETTTRFDTAFSTSNIRSATTSDGVTMWAAGSASGVYTVQFGTATAAQVLATPASGRALHVIGGQLYGTSGSSPFTNVYSIGAGLPVTLVAAAQAFAGMATSGASPYSFALFDRNPNVAGRDTLYVADDRAIASSGGVQKWVTADGTNWTLDKTISTGLTTGVRGLTGYVAGSTVVLFVTTTEAAANKLVRILDDGVNVSATTLVTAATNTAFRGVAIAPQ